VEGFCAFGNATRSLSNLVIGIGRGRIRAEGRSVDPHLQEEIAGHLAFLIEENLRAGMSPAEARRQAALKLDSAVAIREDHHAEQSQSLQTTPNDFLALFEICLRTLRPSHTGFQEMSPKTLISSVLDFLTRCRLPVTDPAARFNEVLHFPDVARPTDATPARTHSGEVRHLRRHARMYRGRVARVVDHMVDRAVIAERHGDHVVEPYRSLVRRLDCAGQHYVRINKDAVHA